MGFRQLYTKQSVQSSNFLKWLTVDKAQTTLLKCELTLTSKNPALYLRYFTLAIFHKKSNGDYNKSVHLCLAGKTDHFVFLFGKRGKRSLTRVAFCTDGQKQQPVSHVHLIPVVSLISISEAQSIFNQEEKNAINLFIRTMLCVEKETEGISC